MSTKKDFLKLLAKTSVVAMTALTAGNAMAANVTVNGGTANLQTGDNTDKGGILLDNDTLTMGSAQSIDFNTTPALIVGGVDLGGADHTGKSINVTHNAAGASIGAIGNEGASGIDLSLADATDANAYIFSLTGTAAAANVLADVYTGLDGITIGNNATLSINSTTGTTTFAGDIDGSANNQGILTTNAKAVNFDGDVGLTSRLKTINTGAGVVTFKGSVVAQTMNVADGQVNFTCSDPLDTVTANVNMNHDNSVIKLSGDLIGAIKTTNANKGIVQVNADDITITGSIGESDGNRSIQEVKFLADHKLNLVGSAYGNFTNAAINEGILNVTANNAVIEGDLGTAASNLNSVTFGANNTLTFAGEANVANGIKLDGANSVLKLNGNNTKADKIVAANNGDGTIQTEAGKSGFELTEIGANGTNVGTLRALGGTELKGASYINDVAIGTNATLTASGALTAGTSLNPDVGATNTKFVINNANSSVGSGGVGALSEVNFASNHSLTLDASGAGQIAKFQPVKVTANTSGHGTLAIKTHGNGGFISSDIGDIASNKSINKLSVEFAADAHTGLELRGDQIHAGTIYITGEAMGMNKEQGFIVGKNASNSAHKPQVIKGTIDAAANGHFVGLDIQGHTAINGNINMGVTDIRFDTPSNLYYNGTNNAATITFAADGALYAFAGDNTIGSSFTIPVTKTGSIIATGVTYADAETAFLAGDTSFDVRSKKYTNTLTLTGSISDVAAETELKLIDAGDGTVVFQGGGGGFVAVDHVKAHTVRLAAADTYDIDKLEIERLEIAGNVTFPKGSEFLGTKSAPLAATLAIDGGAQRNITIGDTVDVHISENGVKQIAGSSGGNAHKLTFQGSSNVYSQLGNAASQFNEVDAAGDGKIVTLHEDVYSQFVGLDHANAVIDVRGNVYAAVMPANGFGGDGTLKISGSDKEITQIGDIAGDQVGKVILNSEKAKVTGGFHVDNLEFAKDGELTINGNALINTAITTLAGGDTGTLIVEHNNFTVNANVGSDQARLKALKMGAGTNLMNIADAKVIHTTIHDSGNGSGVVNFAGGSVSPKLDIGTKDSPISSVTFAGNAVTFRDAHATNINVNDKTVSFRGAYGTTNLTTGTLNVLAGGHASIKGNGGVSTVNVTGSTATLAKVGEAGSTIGTLNINTANSVVALDSADIHATAFNHKNATVNAAGAVNVKGTYTATNAVMSAKGPVTISGATTFDGTYKLTSASSGLALDLTAIDPTINTMSGFNLVLDAANGASIKSGAEVLAFKADYVDAVGNLAYDFLAKTNISTNHAFRKVSLKGVANSKKAQLVVEDNTKAAIDSLVLPKNQATAVTALLTDAANDDLANDIGQTPESLGGMAGSVKRYAATEENMEKVSADVAAVMDSTAGFTNNRVSAAMASGAVGVPSNAVRVKAERLGVAAGDASERFGVWGNVIGGMAKQESRKGTSPFRSNIFGGILGADTLLDDRSMVGFAVGNAMSNVKYKGAKVGDKIKTTSWVFSTYGSYSFNDNWFIRGNLTASSNKVDSSEKRVGLAGARIAKASYNVEAYSAEAALGYNYRTAGGGTFTPSVGLKMARVSDIKFRETGAGVQSKEVSHKATNIGSVIAGASYTTSTDWNGMLLTPEAHMNLQYGLGVKTPKGKYRALGSGTFASYQGQKAGRFAANFGASATSHVNNVEYGVGYDLNIADKYLGHQGSLKVKVKF